MTHLLSSLYDCFVSIISIPLSSSIGVFTTSISDDCSQNQHEKNRSNDESWCQLLATCASATHRDDQRMFTKLNATLSLLRWQHVLFACRNTILHHDGAAAVKSFDDSM